MNSPSESGPPRSAEGPGTGDDSVDRHSGQPPASASGQVTDAGVVPPWQRGVTRTHEPHPPAPGSPPRQDPRSPGLSPGADARPTRVISGAAAPAQAGAGAPEPESPSAGSQAAGAEGYGSELPDLSGPPPRPAQGAPAIGRGPDSGTTDSGTTDSGTRARLGRSAGLAARVQVAARSRGPVRASMQIRHIDPWSTLKVSLILSVALFFVWMIAVAFLYLVLGGMGVWSKLNSNVGDLLTNTSSSGELVSGSSIFGGAALIGLVNIVLLTAMATVGAFIYNLSTDLVGGVEVTLADRD